MTDLALQSASELARRLRRREISAQALLRRHLDRVARLNPALNAVVVLDAERALQRAREADAALAGGTCWGPLHGLPMTVKEAFDVAGLPTTWGFEALRDNRPAQHARAVQRLLDAGAVIFGKTNVPVALADWQTFNPIHGTTNNPWDLARVPGGSSGGSAAALAAGLTPLELGSDIGASIRNPAHYCGVYGHKPTWGVVPLQGHQLPGEECPDATDIGAAGPMARSAFDLSLALDVLSAPLTAMTPLGRLPVSWRDAGVPPTRCRVAVVADDPLAEVDRSVKDALQALVEFLRREGVEVDEQARPVDSATTHRVFVHLQRAASGAMLDDARYADAQQQAAARPAQDDSFPARHWRGLAADHRSWVHVDDERWRLRRQWADFFERFDLLICPIATTAAFAHNPVGPRWERLIEVNGRPQPSTDQLFWAGYTNLCGLPATAVPIGRSPQGLPIGAQICGPLFADPVTLRFARWLETAFRGYEPPPLALS